MTHPSPHSTSPSVAKDKAGLVHRFLRLRPYFGKLPGTWVLVAMGAAVGAATEPMIPALLKPLLDRGFQQGSLAIWTVPTALLLLFGARGLAGYVSQIGLTKITNHGMLAMRQAMFKAILNGHVKLFSEQTSSALSNTVVYEVQNGSVMLVNSLLSLTRNGLILVALTAYLLFLNWKLTLIVAAVFPAVAVVMRLLTRRLHSLTKENLGATDELAYVVEENVLAHRDIRLCNAQQGQLKRFTALSETLQRLAMKSTVAGAAMTPMTQMLAAIALSAVISVALLQSASSGTTVGGFVAFVTAMLMIVAPIRQLSEVSSPITKGLVALERALDLIESTPPETQGEFTQKRVMGNIRFEQIRVQYSPEAAPAIGDLSLSINAGETVALVGASGSGKTTLVNLLPRFVDLNAGNIYLDDQDIRTWSLAALRTQFAMVSQHVVMVNDTIAANIALGDEIEPEKLARCLKAAHLSSWVDTLARGVDTIVGHNAVQLSGGQRQRLAIARALYKDAPILILDEATSALDTESERAVQEALLELMRNRTTLVVAHRLSTIQHADRIVVMDAGQVVETGNHNELIQKDGPYAKLHQLGLHAPGNLLA